MEGWEEDEEGLGGGWWGLRTDWEREDEEEEEEDEEDEGAWDGGACPLCNDY